MNGSADGLAGINSYAGVAFLMLRQTEVAIPSWHQYHIVRQILPLNFKLLHNHYIRLEDVKHAIEGARLAPWLVAKGIADAVYVPCRNAKSHDSGGLRLVTLHIRR